MTNPTPTPLAIARELRRLAKSRYSIRDAVRDRLLMLADEAEALSEPAVAGGLDPDQEIRARAVQAAATALGPTLAAATPMTMQQFDVARERLLDLTETLIELIRTGSRP